MRSDETLDAGRAFDLYGRRVLALRAKNSAPATTDVVSGGIFELVTEMVCPADGNNQTLFSTFRVDGTQQTPTIAHKTINMDAAHSLAHYVTPVSTANIVTIEFAEGLI